jgi:uncharacterized protein YqgC (DUF456 family)
MFNCGFNRPEDMMPLVAYLFLASRVGAVFPLAPSALFTFIDLVRGCMSSAGNTYHNFSHAVDVMQSVFVMLFTYEAA